MISIMSKARWKMSFSDCEGLILPRLYNWGRKQNRTWKLFKKKHTTIQMTGSSQNPRTMILSPAGLQRCLCPSPLSKLGHCLRGSSHSGSAPDLCICVRMQTVLLILLMDLQQTVARGLLTNSPGAWFLQTVFPSI